MKIYGVENKISELIAHYKEYIMRKIILMMFFLSSGASANASEDIHYDSWTIPENLFWNIPYNIILYMKKPQSGSKYIVYRKMNPVYLRLDIDGDGWDEHAVFIQNLNNKKIGILLCKINSQCQILFAGKGVRNIGSDDLKDNLNYVDFWQVDERKEIERYPELPPPPRKIGEGINFGRSESSARMLYWDGSGFVTYQLSD